jgi:hypothetical protein
MPPLKNGFVFASPIRRKRDYGTGAMALTEYKVDRVRSRTASCNGLDRWICDDIFEGIDNVATLLIGLDGHRFALLPDRHRVVAGPPEIHVRERGWPCVPRWKAARSGGCGGTHVAEGGAGSGG